MKLKLNILFLVFVIFSTTITLFTKNYEGLRISEIVFDGQKNTKKELLLSAIDIKKKDIYNKKKITKAIQDLYKLGLFENIFVDITKTKENALILTFHVSEYPIVQTIKYEGMKKVNSSDIEEDVKKIIEDNSVYSLKNINAVKNLIRNKYNEEGYLDVLISVEEKKEKNNYITLIFKVNEGPKTIVNNITIIGNTIYSDKKILGKMDTKKKTWLHGGVFDDLKYAADKQKIITLYQDNGYIKAHIVSDTITTNIIQKKHGKKLTETKELDIKIKLFEGAQYKFGGYTISGYTIFTKDMIWKNIKQKKEEIFNTTLFQKEIGSIQQLYAGRGYIFAQVIPEEALNEKTKTITYNVTIFEGEIAHIENILIKGNTKTKDYVIRRELTISEGDIFDADKIRRSQEKIHNLGFFKNVNLDVKPGSAEGLMNLIIIVEEQQTGMITLGATYSGDAGFGGYEEVSENNLLGKGYRIHEKIQYQQKLQNYELGASTPWVMNRPISLNISLYYRHENVTTASNGTVSSNNWSTNYSYIQNKYGISLGAGRRFNDYLGVGGGYNFQFYQNSDIGSAVSNIEAGSFLKNVFSFYFNYDSRDNIFNPTKGKYLKQTFAMSYGLAGNDTYNKYTTDLGFYFPTFWKFTLVLHGYFGYVGQSFFSKDFNITYSDQFRLGTADTIRGYSQSAPWTYYGNSLLYFNIEHRFPIGTDMLWGTMYVDGGYQWTNAEDIHLNFQDYAYSVGFGLRVQIPMLPIRLYWSYKFGYDDNTQQWKFLDSSLIDGHFDFSIGGLF